MLQKMQELGLKALAKVVDPPMNAPSNMKDSAKSIIPGGVTYVDTQQGQQGFSPTFQINPDLNSMEFKIERTQTAIDQTFFKDLFLMISASNKTNMTATEVIERHEEKLLMVGPVVERLQPELLDRSIDRVYDIMENNNLLPEPPPELEGMDIEVEYISLLAQAQKAVGISSLEQTVNFAGSLSELWPEARHKLNALQAIDEFAKMAGAPVSVVVSDEEVEAKIQAEAQQIAEAQQKEDAARAIQGAKTLSETDTEKPSALKAVAETGAV